MRKSDFTLPTLDDLFSTQAERDYRLFRMLNGLKAELPQLQKEEIMSRLEAILNELK